MTTPSADETRLADEAVLETVRADVAEFIDDVTLNEDVAAVLRLLDDSRARLTEVERERDEFKKRLAIVRDKARTRFELGLMPWLLDEGPCSDTALQLANILSSWHAAEKRASALAAALDPFARIYDINAALKLSPETPMRDCCPGVWPTLDDCERARAALSPKAESNDNG